MWPWWVKIPSEYFADVTLAIGDIYGDVRAADWGDGHGGWQGDRWGGRHDSGNGGRQGGRNGHFNKDCLIYW